MISRPQGFRNPVTCCIAPIPVSLLLLAQNNRLACSQQREFLSMDRRTVLASLGAVVAATPLKAQESPPHWSSPVIDMHFHMRASPAQNIAHQQGAGITAANLLTHGE